MKRSLSLTAVAAVTLASAAVAVVAATPASAVAVSGQSRYVAVTPTRALDTRLTGLPATQGSVLNVSLGTGAKGVVPPDASAVVLNLTATAPTAAGYLTVYPFGTTRPQASSLNKRAGETRSNSVTVQLPSDDSGKISIYNQAGTTQVIVDVLGFYVPTQGTTQGSDYYVPDNPARATDTRTDGKRVPNNGIVDVALERPSGLSAVSAVAVNITAVAPTGPGYVTAWDGQGAQPGISVLNYGTDAVTPNFAIVPTSTDDEGDIVFRVENHVATTDLIIDVFGVYAAPGADGATTYVPTTPSRLTDTRTTAGGGPIAQNTSRDVAVPDGDAGLVAAVNANVTAVDATVPTFLTVFASGSDRPNVSNLNPFTPDALANAVQTSATPDFGDNGSQAPVTSYFSIYNSQGSVDAVADLQGYFVLDGLSGLAARTAPRTIPAPRVSSTQH